MDLGGVVGSNGEVGDRPLTEQLSHAAVFMFDHELRFEMAAGSALDAAGMRRQDVEGRTLLEVLSPRLADQLLPHYTAALGGENRAFEFFSPTRERSYWVSVGPMRADDGSITGGLAVAFDIDEPARSQADERLRTAEERFRAAFENASIGMGLVAPDGRIFRANDAWSRIVGRPRRELEAMRMEELVHPAHERAEHEQMRALVAGENDHHRAELRHLDALGASVWVQVDTAVVRDRAGEPLHLVVQVQDITDRRRLESELYALAVRDPLTGVANRRRWDDELARELASARREGTGFCVAVLDLDGFKPYNDARGHQEGDRLLKAAASAWRAELRGTDTIARLGGDEFGVILPGAPAHGHRPVVDRLRAGVPCEQTCSAGIACWNGEEPGGALVARADAALYRAKREGGDRTVVVGREAVERAPEAHRLAPSRGAR